MSAAMEQICTPTRRYQDAFFDHDWDDDDGNFHYTELQLAIPVEDFLVYHWDWTDLKAFLTRDAKTIMLWITEHAFLVVEEGGLDMGRFEDHRYIAADIRVFTSWQEQEQVLILGHEHALILVQTSLSDKPTAELNVFWYAVATSNSVELRIKDELDSDDLGLPSGPLLSQFLRERPLHQFLEFDGLTFRKEHCRALATLERTDLRVSLRKCTLDPQDAEDTFIDWFRHNQIVTDLYLQFLCDTGDRMLSALSGNNSLKNLIVRSHDKRMHSLFQALPGNMGIEDLTVIVDDEMSDEILSLLFRSLSTHPRIERVTFEDNYSEMDDLSAESKSTLMNAILEMLQHNTVVHTIYLPHALGNEEVYQNSVLPRLEMNRNCFEVQRQTVKRADPAIRSQLLGRVLHVVRCNPNLVFRFLSENVPAFIRTEEEEDVVRSAISLQKEPATIVSGQKRKAPL
jgi:hypothetical protein